MRKKPVIKEYSCCEELGKCITIVQLSDLHNCIFGKDNFGLVKAVSDCRPDIILFSGDMINKHEKHYKTALSVIERIASVAPCFYGYGNHELIYSKHFTSDCKEYEDALKKLGITVLRDDSVITDISGIPFEIGGFTADEKAYTHFKKLPVYSEVTKRKNPNITGLLISHNPELYESYEKSGWNYIFSGHLHGGIIRIPGFRGIVSPSGRLFPKYSGGLYRLKNNKMIVSRGLGSHTVKLRIFNPPELVKITLS